MAKGWLDNYGKEDNYNDSSVSAPEGFRGDGYSNVGRNYSPAWGGQFQMGGSLPGATGHMYARVGAPSNGKYAKKTLASAQDGKWLDKWKEDHPSVRSIQNDVMNRKIQEHKGKSKETNVVQKDNTKTVTPKEIKKLSGKQQNELAQKQSEEQARKDQVFENMQEAYKSPLMSPGYFTPEGMAIGAIQGATKLGPDLYEGNYKEAALDALMVLPEVGNIAKALGPSKGLLSNTYKLNPWAERLNDANKSYRVAGLDALEDFNNAGILRSQRTLPENATFLDRVNARPTPFPSFQKGYADLNYLPEEGGVIFETTLPTFKRGQVNPVTGKVIDGRHYAHRVIDPETGKVLTEIPASAVKVFGDKPHWLKGYKQVEVPKSNFESEIDWSKWNKEIPENTQLMREYNAIEETSKANGSWMKNPDGSVFKGTPEQFIQQNSKNFNKAFPNGVEEFYRGNQHFNPELNSGNHSGFDTHITFGTSNKDIAEKYATNGGFNLNDEYQNIGKQVDFYHPDINTPGTYTGSYADVDAGMYHVGVDKNLEKKIVEGNNERWFNVDDPETLEWKRNEYPDFRTEVEKGFEERQIDKVSTDNIAGYIADKQIPLAKVKNLNDDLAQFNGKSSDIIMINPKLAKPKSLRYNNGMFDMSNPNIYKSIVPGAIGLGAASQIEQKREGGVIKDDMGQWAHPGEITEISGDTMATHGYGNIPLYVVPDKGRPRMVQPNTGTQKFPGAKKFTEYPMAKNGLRQEQKGLQNLDQLTNFTNYNTKQPGGWLDTL
jgi:hypothetical protein